MRANGQSTILNNQSGFSLIQVMVSAALMGILSLGFMQMNQSQIKNQKGLESAVEVNSLHSTITRSLISDSVCDTTFAAKSIASGTNIPTIIGGSGVELFKADGSKVYGGTVAINSINIERVSDLGDVSQPQREVTLKIEYEKRANILKVRDPASGNREFQTRDKLLTLHMAVDPNQPSMPFVKCNSDLNNAIEQGVTKAVDRAIEKVCVGLGGSYDPGTSTCDISNDYIKRSEIFNGDTCVTGTVLVGYDIQGDRICDAIAGGGSDNCEPSTWTPAVSDICDDGSLYTQRSDCGTTQQVYGDKTCSSNPPPSCEPNATKTKVGSAFYDAGREPNKVCFFDKALEYQKYTDGCTETTETTMVSGTLRAKYAFTENKYEVCNDRSFSLDKVAVENVQCPDPSVSQSWPKTVRGEANCSGNNPIYDSCAATQMPSPVCRKVYDGTERGVRICRDSQSGLREYYINTSSNNCPSGYTSYP